VFARDAGLSPRINIILVEQQASVCAELRQTLQELGLTQRVKETTQFERLSNGQIALVNANCLDIADKLLAYTTSEYRCRQRQLEIPMATIRNTHDYPVASLRILPKT
jgi:hypothetical protein